MRRPPAERRPRVISSPMSGTASSLPSNPLSVSNRSLPWFVAGNETRFGARRGASGVDASHGGWRGKSGGPDASEFPPAPAVMAVDADNEACSHPEMANLSFRAERRRGARTMCPRTGCLHFTGGSVLLQNQDRPRQPCLQHAEIPLARSPKCARIVEIHPNMSPNT